MRLISGTRKAKKIYGMNSVASSPNTPAAKTAGTDHGTRLMPTVPTASAVRVRLSGDRPIFLYGSTNARAGSRMDTYCSPLANATAKPEEIGRASCRERVESGVGAGAVKREEESGAMHVGSSE